MRGKIRPICTVVKITRELSGLTWSIHLRERRPAPSATAPGGSTRPWPGWPGGCTSWRRGFRWVSRAAGRQPRERRRSCIGACFPVTFATVPGGFGCTVCAVRSIYCARRRAGRTRPFPGAIDPMLKRQGNKPKRRIIPRDALDPEDLERLAGEARYVGSAHHKSKPADYRFTPPTSLRPNKSLCDGRRIVSVRGSGEAFSPRAVTRHGEPLSEKRFPQVRLGGRPGRRSVRSQGGRGWTALPRLRSERRW